MKVQYSTKGKTQQNLIQSEYTGTKKGGEKGSKGFRKGHWLKIFVFKSNFFESIRNKER